jgi:hypothetical protein
MGGGGSPLSQDVALTMVSKEASVKEIRILHSPLFVEPNSPWTGRDNVSAEAKWVKFVEVDADSRFARIRLWWAF